MMISLNDIKQILNAFGLVFKREITGDLVKLYFSVLKDIDVDLLKIAAKECIANNKFFPLPADLRRMVVEIAQKQDGLISANEAWAEVQKYLINGNREYIPAFSNEIIKKSVEAVGGWFNLCNYQIDDLKIIRPQFLKMYDSFMTRAKVDFNLLPDTKKYLNESQKQLNGVIGELSGKMRLGR